MLVSDTGVLCFMVWCFVVYWRKGVLVSIEKTHKILTRKQGVAPFRSSISCHRPAWRYGSPWGINGRNKKFRNPAKISI
jgi:hypothetical protein